MEHSVEAGDIWRAAFTKDDSIQDWVKLAANRAKATGVRHLFVCLFCFVFAFPVF